MKRVLSVLSNVTLSLVVVFSLAACGEKDANSSASKSSADSQPVSQFMNTDVTGLGYAHDFALTDHTGKPRTLADFKGKAVVVFFGYTQCPDVCPTTMAEMANAMKELGPLADKVQVLFITLDPARDTQALLAQYVPAFDPHFLGLYGDQAATDKVAKEFRVFYQKVPGSKAGSYTIDHTAGSYVFDPEGHIRLFVRNGEGPEPLVHDLKLLLN
ncbi:SCO family protein [Glaciimonas soli]|uniref:Redoxin domain-containing protein n=1 Tax=Glaciimonas soli TaxID=2590999 RepID=A0A843YN71_9BURK|nr:SCO family protein [Glaciimonas soli]MQR00400.1 redoxin domain-containing protein [Glaciimonas soli]